MQNQRFSAVVIALVVAAGWAAAALPQAQPPARPATRQPQVTFRVEARSIEVDAVVTDARGQFVRDLTRDDFEVLEDNRPQTVNVFALVDIPVEPADRPLYREAVEPDVAANETELTEGRMYLIALDSLHVDASRTSKVKELARQFIFEHLAANDLAGVVLLGQGESQEFTSSKRLLVAAVNRFVGNKMPSATLLRLEQRPDTELPNDPARTEERAAVARDMLTAIRTLSQYVAGLRGRRKALVLFSEGLDFNTDVVISGASDRVTDTMGSALVDGLLAEQREMLGAATRSNVSIYSVDPRGVASGADEIIKLAGMPEGSESSIPMKELEQEVRRSQDTLRVYARETGGLAAVGSGDFGQAFRRIVADSSAYYVLGYTPTNAQSDGKFRRITVRLKRPGLTVRARPGYYAPRADETAAAPAAAASETSPRLRELLASPTQIRGLPLRVTADAFKGPAPKALVHLLVELPAGSLAFQDRNGLASNDVEMVFRAIDSRGAVQASTRKLLDLRLRPATRDAVQQHGFRVTTEIELPPGRYQVRVAAQETAGGRSGSVFVNLEVPDFTKPALGMSDVVIMAESAEAWPARGDAATFKELLPGPPTAVRAFARSDAIAVFAEIYDNDARPHRVDVTTIVRSDEGKQVFETTDARDRDEIAAGRGFGYVATIPLEEPAPGRYVLTVEARSRLTGVEPVSKDVEFMVR
jgi:VWFA-related protein